MGIKNFETGGVVQKFDREVHIMFNFFSKAHINKTLASTGIFHTDQIC